MELTGTSAEGKSRRKWFREFLASHKLLQRIQLHSRYESRLTSSVNSPPKSRGFLADDKLKLRDYLSFSNINMPTVNEFSPFVIPVTTTSIGRISGYIAMVSLNYLLLSIVVVVFYKSLIFCSLKLCSRTSHQVHLEHMIWLLIKSFSVSSVALLQS